MLINEGAGAHLQRFSVDDHQDSRIKINRHPKRHSKAQPIRIQSQGASIQKVRKLRALSNLPSLCIQFQELGSTPVLSQNENSFTVVRDFYEAIRAMRQPVPCDLCVGCRVEQDDHAISFSADGTIGTLYVRENVCILRRAERKTEVALVRRQSRFNVQALLKIKDDDAMISKPRGTPVRKFSVCAHLNLMCDVIIFLGTIGISRLLE
ncbi:MAG: hypothetical protein ACTH2M_09155 [Microbacteriaceae bacterium]